jgi:NFU1 iron-sulfur cluster scaffold homolog, mitochondrial
VNNVLVRIQATPNPNAWKFVLDRPVLLEGKATFVKPEEATGNQLATDLLNVEGINQVHFFQNVITLTIGMETIADEIHQIASNVIQTRLPDHEPKLGMQESKMASRKDLPEVVQQIEEILDRTIRPGLQGDGGDIEVLKFDDNSLYVHYQGACGTCPSSTEGTLLAIEGILKDELGYPVKVIPT